ncbi:MAG: A/G-specific adenine glycosylase [Bacteroidota bacterium]|nr:A/G-specific adenine glycosylase [Bacteroidota bacterium]
MQNQKFFSNTLLDWNETENKRQMPWKGESNPYRIWISEIILQQTRVQQGMEYYNRFIAAFPDIETLAMASEKEVYKLWEGLGYYSRCKNLIASAKFIQEELNGNFPEKYEDILALKGIGTYTASAIASFAFNLPYAVLDGNVFRVLSRFFGKEIPINTTEGKRFYGELSQSLLSKITPGKYNQALMDFGAVICKPAAPLCLQCPLQKKCFAFLKNKVAVLPVNTKTIRQKERFFNYLVVEYKNKFYVRKRTGKDIWQNLYEFVLIETKDWLDESKLIVNEEIIKILNQPDFTVNLISSKISQKLTHQLITGRFIHIELKKPWLNNEYFTVNRKELKALPFPKFIASYLADKNVSLN